MQAIDAHHQALPYWEERVIHPYCSTVVQKCINSLVAFVGLLVVAFIKKQVAWFNKSYSTPKKIKAVKGEWVLRMEFSSKTIEKISTMS